MGCSLPVDPDGGLDRARGGVLEVGATPHGEWVEMRPGADPSGLEIDLIRAFADSIDAEVEITGGSEAELVEGLEDGDLDIAVGGFTEDTPWKDRVGMTRPYLDTEDETGATIHHVVLTRMGENAFLLELDEFLLAGADGVLPR